MSASRTQMSSARISETRSDGQSGAIEVPCIEKLRQTPLFAGLSDSQLKVIAPPCHLMPICQGRFCFCEGDHAGEIFVVLQGEVCLEVELFMGRHLPPRIIEVERVGEYGVFGLCALVEPRRTLLTARCVRDTELVAINSDQLRALMRANPAIGLVVMENALKTARERLMRSQERLINELGLAAMYQSHRNY